MNQHRSRYRVYWEDTDAGGVVYHARYLHFLERARTDHLLAIDCSQSELKIREQRLFVVTRIEMDFLAAARLEDELWVSSDVEQLKGASVLFHQRIERISDGQLLFQARVHVACVQAQTFKPARLPDRLRQALQPNED